MQGDPGERMRAGSSDPGGVPAARKRPTGKALGGNRASAIPETDGGVGGQGLLPAGKEQESQ